MDAVCSDCAFEGNEFGDAAGVVLGSSATPEALDSSWLTDIVVEFLTLILLADL